MHYKKSQKWGLLLNFLHMHVCWLSTFDYLKNSTAHMFGTHFPKWAILWFLAPPLFLGLGWKLHVSEMIISPDTMARKELKGFTSRGGWFEIWGTEATCDLAQLRTRGSASYYRSVVQFPRKTQLQPFVNVSLLYHSCHLCTIVYCEPPIFFLLGFLGYLSDALWRCPPSPSPLVPFWAFIQPVNSCP